MTQSRNARVAGVGFLVYIAAGLTSMAGPPLPLRVVLSLVMALSAFVLGVSLFAITRSEDVDIARLAMICRVAEGVIGATGTQSAAVTGTYFAAGSLLFSWLLLRGRMIPIALAWIGVVASAILLTCLPLQVGKVLAGPITAYIWLPMLAFEVPLAGWFIVKGIERRNG